MFFSDYAATDVVNSVQSMNSSEIRTNLVIKGNKRRENKRLLR